MNGKELRQHLAELLARQRNPDQPAKKQPPTPEPTPKSATMSNKEFRRHLKQLVARQRNEGQLPAVEKKPTENRTLETSRRHRKEASSRRDLEVQGTAQSQVASLVLQQWYIRIGDSCGHEMLLAKGASGAR